MVRASAGRFSFSKPGKRSSARSTTPRRSRSASARRSVGECLQRDLGQIIPLAGRPARAAVPASSKLPRLVPDHCHSEPSAKRASGSTRTRPHRLHTQYRDFSKINQSAPVGISTKSPTFQRFKLANCAAGRASIDPEAQISSARMHA